jgi:hypothetical protein
MEFIIGIALGLMVYGWYQAVKESKDIKKYNYKTARRKLKEDD